MLLVGSSGRTTDPAMAAFPTVFRQRVLDSALRGNATEHAVADRFAVSRSFVQKLKRQFRRDGTVEPVGHRGGAPSKLSADDRAALVAWLGEAADAPCAANSPPGSPTSTASP